MKAAVFFALRYIRRKPGKFAAMAAVSAAILTILVMMLFYLDTDWRARVMPDTPENYHFKIVNLTESQKSYVRRQNWVQATYDINVTDYDGEFIRNDFRVRVVWSEVLRSSKHAWEILDEFGLWSDEYYAANYQRLYNKFLTSITKEWLGLPPDTMLPTGMTIAQNAENNAKHELVMSVPTKNVSFCRDCIDSYVIRPEFFMLLALFALFLGGTMMILLSERYKGQLAEFGNLRALGMKKKQLVMVSCFDSLFISLASIPVGAAAASLAVRLYSLLTDKILAGDSIYRNLLKSMPVASIAIISVLMTIVTLLGTLLVCYLNRNREITDMIRGSDVYQVSFVAKTSPRFEKSRGSGIYSRLWLRRTRRSFLLAVAVVVLMMPLPLIYLLQSADIVTKANLSVNDIAEGCYYLFQTLILLITAEVVIYVSSRSRTDDRHSEFGILRSLGMSKRGIRRIASPATVAQILMTVIPAVLIFSKLTENLYRPLDVDKVRALNIDEFVRIMLIESVGVLLLVAPALLLGLFLSLRRFNRASVIESIRESE